jgi:hypothetical protein
MSNKTAKRKNKKEFDLIGLGRMGGEERARLRHAVSAASKLTAVVPTLAMLAVGTILAACYGDFSMRQGQNGQKADAFPRRGGFPGQAAFGYALRVPRPSGEIREIRSTS